MTVRVYLINICVRTCLRKGGGTVFKTWRWENVTDRNFNCNNYINDNTELLINNIQVPRILSVAKYKI